MNKHKPYRFINNNQRLIENKNMFFSDTQKKMELQIHLFIFGQKYSISNMLK